jgi:flagellar biosynthesis protein FlhF
MSMLVKVFEAEEMSAALKMVKETLGPDALILSTRTLRKGGMGVFGKPVLEVTAAVESPAIAPVSPSAAARSGKPVLAVADAGPEPELNYRDLWRRSSVVNVAGGAETAAPAPVKDAVGEGLAAVRAELDELKAMLRQANLALQPARAERESGFTQAYALAAEPGGLQCLLGDLARWGVEAEVAETIVRRAQERLASNQLGDAAQRQDFLQATICEMIQVTGSIFARNRQQQRIALIGPTGVGKTTTLAKLAADYLTYVNGKVALVTIDTYRIAAVEQLKVYGEILCLPVEVVFSPAELQAAFAKHADKDLILVDTAGRSPRDDQRLDELAAFLGPESGTSNHLVLAAPTRNRELQETARRFGRLPLDSVIFTKLDECEGRGALLNIPVCRNLPVSYLTNGQRVPEDLLTAEPATIADYVMGHA